MSDFLEVLRMEKKYLLNLQEMSFLWYKLSQVLKGDIHNGSNGYLVRSLYFDTIDDKDFYDKYDGYEMRRKIRLRVYDPSGNTAKLEMKEKQGDLQRKRSLTLNRKDALALCKGNYTPLLAMNTEFSLELYSRMMQFIYVPKCIVEYDRKACFVSENNTRITIDANLRATEAVQDLFMKDIRTYPVGIANSGTLEVKYSNFLLSYVKDLVSLTGRTQMSLSKYCAARSISMHGYE